MKSIWIRTIACSLALGLAFPSAAWANYFCNGSIESAAISPDGFVTINSPAAGLSFVRLCSVNSTVNNGVYGISPDACKGILATVLRAQATGATVQWGFIDEPTTCAGHTAWQQLTGWYWGPAVMNQ